MRLLSFSSRGLAFASVLMAGATMLGIAGSSLAGEECPAPPAMTAGESAAMLQHMTDIDAALRASLAGYQFGLWPGKAGADREPDDTPTQTQWTKAKAILSCTDLTVYYTYTADWLVTARDGDLGHEWANEIAMLRGEVPPFPGDGHIDDPGDPNYAAMQQQSIDAEQAATITLSGNFTPDMFEALNDAEHPDLTPYPTPHGAVAAYSSQDIGTPSYIKVYVLVGPWSQVKNDLGRLEYRPAAGGFVQPQGANAMKLTVTGTPEAVSAFLAAFDGSKLGL